MAESEKQIANAAYSDNAAEVLIASRLLDNPKDFLRWECEHSNIMRRVAAVQSLEAQKSALLAAAVTLIHRKSLFEFLRDHQVRGPERIHLVKRFFQNKDFMYSMVTEHGNYLRSAGSHLCSRHLGAQIMLDEVFDIPLERYEDLYTRYFAAYCNFALAQYKDPSHAHWSSKLMLLKKRVDYFRGALFRQVSSSTAAKSSGNLH